MDKQIEAVADALKSYRDSRGEPMAQGSCIGLAKAAIKASGAEHLRELVEALEEVAYSPHAITEADCRIIAEKALAKLPPEVRGV